MIEALITSKTRIKLLLKFFLNSDNSAYLRNLESELGESANGIRIELTRMEESDLLISELKGNRKYYRANTQHPLYGDIHNILLKFVGIDKVVEQVLAKMGDLDAAYVAGDLAKGSDAKIIDILLVGENINSSLVDKLVKQTEKHISRKIRYMILSREQLLDIFKDKAVLLIWKHDKYLVDKK